jgi:hypothetical protein
MMAATASWTSEQEAFSRIPPSAEGRGPDEFTDCGFQTYPAGEGTGRLVAYPEMIWTRQANDSYVRSGAIPDDETHVKTFWKDADGEVRGGNIARPIAEAVTLLESLMRTGPCCKPAYILRACNPPKSIGEKIEETTFPLWSGDLLLWFQDNKHSSEHLLRGLCPRLPEEEL